MTKEDVFNLSNKSLYNFNVHGIGSFVGILEQPPGGEEYYLIKTSDIRSLNEARNARDSGVLAAVRVPVKLEDIISWEAL